MLALCSPALAGPRGVIVPRGPNPATTSATSTHPDTPAHVAGVVAGGERASSWGRPAVWGLAALILAGLWKFGVMEKGFLPKPKAAGGTGGGGGGGQPAWAFVMGALVIYLSGVLGYALAQSLLPWPRDATVYTSQGRAWAAVGYYALGIPAGLALVTLTSGGLRKVFALKDPVVGLLVLAMVFPLVMVAGDAASTAAALIEGQRPSPVAHETLKTIVADPKDRWALVMAACAVVGAPVFEEILYRYFLQTGIALATGTPWIAILATSALFALSHRSGDQVPWHALAPLFVLSVTLGAAYAKTGRLGVVIVMHAGFNLANILVALWITGA